MVHGQTSSHGQSDAREGERDESIVMRDVRVPTGAGTRRPRGARGGSGDDACISYLKAEAERLRGPTTTSPFRCASRFANWPTPPRKRRRVTPTCRPTRRAVCGSTPPWTLHVRCWTRKSDRAPAREGRQDDGDRAAVQTPEALSLREPRRWERGRLRAVRCLRSGEGWRRSGARGRASCRLGSVEGDGANAWRTRLTRAPDLDFVRAAPNVVGRWLPQQAGRRP